MQDIKNRLTIELIALGVFLVVAVALVSENAKLKSQLDKQTETTEYAINALEKCSGHLSEVSYKLVDLREQLKTITK